MSDQAARLVVPEGLVVDESARERLERQLEAAPESWAGVGAAVSPLAPGASYRVHAEWSALETPDDLRAGERTGARGGARPPRGVVRGARRPGGGGGVPRDRPGRAHPRPAPLDRRARDRVGTRTAAVSAAAGRRVPGARRSGRRGPRAPREPARPPRRRSAHRRAGRRRRGCISRARVSRKRRRSAPWPPTWW